MLRAHCDHQGPQDVKGSVAKGACGSVDGLWDRQNSVRGDLMVLRVCAGFLRRCVIGTAKDIVLLFVAL